MTEIAIDPETLVLGPLCKSPAARKSWLHLIEKDDFNSRTYGLICQALKTLSDGGHSIGVESVTAFFTETLDRMQVSFLFDPKKEFPLEITPETYAAFKKGGVRARQIRLRDAIDRELKKGGDPSALTDLIRQQVAYLDGQDAAIEVCEPDAAVDATEWILDQWAKGDRPVISGLPELDEQLFLNQFIGYWVMAGNSGVGKSAMMCNIAKANGRNGVPGTLCSLEMSKELLLIRMAMEDPKVRGLDLNERTIRDPQKMSDLKYAMNAFRRLPVFIVEGVFDIFRLDKISRKMAIERGCKWTLFDYLQLGKTKPTDTDVVRVYTVSRFLQGLTKPDLPNGYKGQSVIALSQYSNESTKAKNDIRDESQSEGGSFNKKKSKPPRPSNSDLAWSGQIKQDADGILHMYPSSYDEGPVDDIEIFCGKQRMYKRGWNVHTKFIKAEQRFVTDMSLKKANAPGSVNTPMEAGRRVKF